MFKKTLESSYLFGSNGHYIEELYDSYLKDPSSVGQEWQQFFGSLEEKTSNLNVLRKLPWVKPNPLSSVHYEDEAEAPAKKPEQKPAISLELLRNFKARLLVDAYRERGHFLSELDPLKLETLKGEKEYHLDLNYFGLNQNDLNEEVSLGNYIAGIDKITLRDLIATLKQTYCRYIAIEVEHIQNIPQKEWIIKEFETRTKQPLAAPQKIQFLKSVLKVEQFEQFLHNRFPGVKRFSAEGGENSLVCIEAIIEESGNTGIDEIVLGMAHRGRLNVLTKILDKPYSAMFSEFQGTLHFPEDMEIAGDVKYHMGASTDKIVNGKKIHLSLTANPSHLEAVNPVVEGKVRAKQDQKKDSERHTVMALLLHGDAAFIGQGVVAETLALNELDGYHTGGTIHIVVNNQVGFTTNPRNARSGRYPTEIAKMVQAPIIHVNGDHPDEIVKMAKLAVAYRNTFKKDIVLDIICYRLHGHNETDEPMFTQPVMYKKIAEQPTSATIYANQLIQEKILKKEEFDQLKTEIKQFFEKEYEAAKTYKPNKIDAFEGKWAGLKRAGNSKVSENTGVPLKKLQTIGKVLCEFPEAIKINPKIARQLEQKKKMIEGTESLDWGTAEALAFGSLLIEGFGVRLSGQDVGRGTFSHRHSVFIDQETEKKYIPLNNIADKQALYEVIDSNLSEYGVLGFEYGYSLAEPNTLVLWEGQFGDFSNGAQIIIDQFISSAESKWLRMSGLVMLLPHGYEGQGPEHSSARLERYLQLCAEDNIQVVNCSTPASYFHVLRRQICREFRKPLIVMSPKSLLRNKVTEIKDLAEGTSFKEVIPETETIVKPEKVRKLIFCSGKIYFELVEERKKLNVQDVAIVRLEQYYPFPKEAVAEQISLYPNAEILFCQEEPKNMGAWFFVEPRIREILSEKKAKNINVTYVGRKEAASPAVGYGSIHKKEQTEILTIAVK